jgi:ribosomal protein L37E
VKRRYCVIFIDLDKERDFFISGMSGLGVDSETAVKILQKAPVILKSNMSFEEAKRYASAVIRAGGRVKLEGYSILGNGQVNQSLTIKTFENFIMCPQCGYKQLDGSTCMRCGFSFSKQNRNGQK